MDLVPEKKLDMFWTILLARRVDERAWVLHRQGKIAFHISGIGQEAAQVGAAFALKCGYDWVAPYYRDLALMMSLGYTAENFMLSLMGKKEESNSGARQMPNHWSIREANVIGLSAPVATQNVHASGIGLAIKLNKEDKVVLTSIGEGSTAQGEWYEAVNWAAIHKLPVIFLVQNNQYAISERPDKQMAVPSVADKACGLGLPGVTVDGTNPYAVYDVVAQAVQRARSGQGATLVEARAYRLTPHSSDDDDRSYRSREEVAENKKSDPILVTRKILEEEGLLSESQYVAMEEKAQKIIDSAVEYASSAPFPAPEEAAYPVYVEEIKHG